MMGGGGGGLADMLNNPEMMEMWVLSTYMVKSIFANMFYLYTFRARNMMGGGQNNPSNNNNNNNDN